MAYWVVARSAPNDHALAVECVGQSFETLVPKIRVKVGARWRTEALFGPYFFVYVLAQWRAIERSMGVAGVVKNGAVPAKCPDGEIAQLIARTSADGIVRLPPRSPSLVRRIIAPGAAVTISAGAFAGFNAIHTGMTAGERELVLINILGASRLVEVAAGLVVPH